MSATISGNVITWPAGDVTPVTLKVGIRAVRSTANRNFKFWGTSDASPLSMSSFNQSSIEFVNVGGYPNTVAPTSTESSIVQLFITPSPHINPHYVSDCQKLLSGGYDA